MPLRAKDDARWMLTRVPSTKCTELYRMWMMYTLI